MNIVQLLLESGETGVAVVDDPDELTVLSDVPNVYSLAQQAINSQSCMADLVAASRRGPTLPYSEILAQKRILSPIAHSDPAHLLVTGTGLTHLGSADARDAMHAKLDRDEAALTDSMKMFRMGLEGGKPVPGADGVQPEWFYKGDGQCVVPPEGDLPLPSFALDGGEEPEIAGIYLIDSEGRPRRLGFCLGNEFSDHKMEQINYLYLAHSKLRTCAIGPELRLGGLPGDIRGTSRIRRGSDVVWEKPFLSGEDNMSHTIANLEAHHFKYAGFRRPGDVHVHFFGTATLSFSDGVAAQAGDIFEIEAEGFGRPLRNTLAQQDDCARAEVLAL